MKYQYLKRDGMVVRPSKKAKSELRIPEYWDFYLSELGDTVDLGDYQNVSKHIVEILKRIKREEQVAFLDELKEIIKERDLKKRVNWENTEYVIMKEGYYREFLKTDIAKKIDAKYHEYTTIFKVATMNDSMKCSQEKNIAFEKWFAEKTA